MLFKGRLLALLWHWHLQSCECIRRFIWCNRHIDTETKWSYDFFNWNIKYSTTLVPKIYNMPHAHKCHATHSSDVSRHRLNKNPWMCPATKTLAADLSCKVNNSPGHPPDLKEYVIYQTRQTSSIAPWSSFGAHIPIVGAFDSGQGLSWAIWPVCCHTWLFWHLSFMACIYQFFQQFELQ